MWLWYLELYVAVLVAFLAGAGVGLLAVRLLVRRTDGFTLGLSGDPADRPAPTTEAAP